MVVQCGARSGRLTLKIQLQRYLQLPHRDGRAGYLSEGSLRQRGLAIVVTRIAPVRMIQEVEPIYPQLQVRALHNFELFDQRKVPVVVLRIWDHISSRIAEGAERLQRESRYVEPFVGCGIGQVHTLSGCVQAIPAVAVAGIRLIRSRGWIARQAAL